MKYFQKNAIQNYWQITDVNICYSEFILSLLVRGLQRTDVPVLN